jgi:hypothetical protein
MDETTKKLYSNLAVVGNTLYIISNDNAENTNYFLARSALTEVENTVASMNLAPEIKLGIANLTKYLAKKIEKRKEQANGTIA